MNIHLNKFSALSALGLAAAISLTACNPQMKFPTLPNPSASGSASPSPTTSATPMPSDSASPVASSTPTPTVSASAAVGGQLTINGADLFSKYNLNYRVGMKWVYGLRLADLAIPSIPGLPSGVTIPGLPTGTGASGASSLGEISWEVISTDNNNVTIKVTTNTNTPVGTQTTNNNITFDKTKQANLYSQAQAPGTNGTVTWTLGASGESVVVPAGTYNADRIEGNFDVVSQTGGATGNLKQQVKTWINSTVGMVKQEVKSDISASGGGASGQTSTTTIIELKSFSG